MVWIVYGKRARDRDRRISGFRELGTAVLEVEGSGIAAPVSILNLTIGASLIPVEAFAIPGAKRPDAIATASTVAILSPYRRLIFASTFRDCQISENDHRPDGGCGECNYRTHAGNRSHGCSCFLRGPRRGSRAIRRSLLIAQSLGKLQRCASISLTGTITQCFHIADSLLSFAAALLTTRRSSGRSGVFMSATRCPQ
jgi:hypothetical protein